MKMCRQADYAQIYDKNGDVRICAWAGYYNIGNLLDNSFEELFAKEKTKKFFNTLREQTYDYCNEEDCPYQANGILETNMMDFNEYPKIPHILSVSYDTHCDYNCTCCVQYDNSPVDKNKQKKIEEEIVKILPDVTELSANGNGEFFCSESTMRVVNAWHPKDKEHAKFELETNGSLFTPSNWAKISNIGNFNLSVAITVMSFEEKAYQYLSGTKMHVSNVIDNLKFVKHLREQGIINQLEIATVVQERNFRMLPEFTRRCLEEFGADRVRIRRFLPQKAMDENIEWFFDVRNPRHPYYQEYLDVMKDPIFKDPRVFNWTGDHLSIRGEIPAEAGYRAMRSFYITDGGKNLGNYLSSHGYKHIILYALGDLCKAAIDALRDSDVTIDYILDAHSGKKEFEGYQVKVPVEKELVKEKTPILVTLAARHQEMETYIRRRGYQGEILTLQEMLDAADSNRCEECCK